MKFIQEILDKAKNSVPKNDALVRDTEVGPEDRVVGELPPELRGLYAVLIESSNELTTLGAKTIGELEKLREMFENTPPREFRAAIGAIEQKLAIPRNNSQTIRDMFWSSVRRTFPELAGENPSLGIRKGWKVAIIPSKAPEYIEIPLPSLSGLGLGGLSEFLAGHFGD